MSRRSILPVVLAGCALCIATTAFANGPEVGIEGGAVFPIESRDVQLVSEEVVLEMPAGEWDTGRARCTYHLRNLTGRRIETAMGFLLNAPIDSESRESWNDMYRRAALRVRQDGAPRAVVFRHQRRSEFRRWYYSAPDSVPSWSLTLAPRAASTVTIEYQPLWGGGSEGSWGITLMRYIARPAALWAGRLEHARFELILGSRETVRLLSRPECRRLVSIHPETGRWTERGVVWEFHNWEPDTDLVFEYGVNEDDPAENPFSPDSVFVLPDVTTGLDQEVVPVDSSACWDYRESTPRPGGWPEVRNRLRVNVGADGRVHSIRYPDGPRELDEVAADCVRRRRFHPPLRKGVPVDAWVDVVVVWPARR